ncbi:MAG: flagellar basal body L-ring protein FlgH [Ignavibacteriales bacterium]|nr:flagellar basal body L-ring protein FlgH [Ignavibacteriales bacterium]
MKTLWVVKIAICVLLSGAAVHAQDMREYVGRSLFSDNKAFRIGDAVTVIVVETSSASNDAATSSNRESNLSFSGSGSAAGKALPDASVGIGTGNKFTGSGSTSSSGSVRAKISARVDTVFANGNLFINGSRTITINGEEQLIQISGVVRPSDVQPDNSVYSYNISDAKILFQGNGIVSRSQEPGWLTKFFHWIF